jgi:hypothetical protein
MEDNDSAQMPRSSDAGAAERECIKRKPVVIKDSPTNQPKLSHIHIPKIHFSDSVQLF